ncbi:hypothetical protein AWB77_00499 [Caballeronia fortuita]|uniref:Uncharacterized protein n=1 Tax=Caballeronia fortuita TaxID=1777138 RepID=A0A157ZD53_9BURK|nr:hypothetical protein [Caballeronia fortuita]SAK42817.1 hypothetical protein AWB77_00499 [Caballeronia fortuita]
MLTNEGADDAEVIVRPAEGGGWRVEIPRDYGPASVTLVSDQSAALELARTLKPNADIRILPADECNATLHGDLSQTRSKLNVP